VTEPTFRDGEAAATVPVAATVVADCVPCTEVPVSAVGDWEVQPEQTAHKTTRITRPIRIYKDFTIVSPASPVYALFPAQLLFAEGHDVVLYVVTSVSLVPKVPMNVEPPGSMLRLKVPESRDFSVP